jgi:hypothetical protein
VPSNGRAGGHDQVATLDETLPFGLRDEILELRPQRRVLLCGQLPQGASQALAVARHSAPPSCSTSRCRCHSISPLATTMRPTAAPVAALPPLHARRPSHRAALLPSAALVVAAQQHERGRGAIAAVCAREGSRLTDREPPEVELGDDGSARGPFVDQAGRIVTRLPDLAFPPHEHRVRAGSVAGQQPGRLVRLDVVAVRVGAWSVGDEPVRFEVEPRCQLVVPPSSSTSAPRFVEDRCADTADRIAASAATMDTASAASATSYPSTPAQ